MTPPVLSVVIPAHNATRHLRTLPTRLAAITESQLPIEVIIVISGVTADERGGVKELRAQLPYARVIALDEPLTAGPARNVGMERASAPRVAFLDVDDLYDLPALFDLVGEMEAAQVDVAVGSYRVQSAQNASVVREEMIHGNPERVLDLIHRHAAVWRYVFDRVWLDVQGIRFDPVPLGEDLIFLIDVDSKRPTILVSPRIHYSYVVDQPTQASGRNAKDMHRQLLLSDLAKRAAERNCPKDVQRLLAVWFLRSWAVGVRNARRSRFSSIGSIRIWRKMGAPVGKLLAALPTVA